MSELETTISLAAERYLTSVAGHVEADALLRDLKDRATKRSAALSQRLEAIAGQVPARQLSPDLPQFAGSNSEQPGIAALQDMYLMMSRAIIGYSKLQTLALRSRDSSALAPEGTAWHLAGAHVHDCIEAIREINRIFPDVLVLELERLGSECICTCPSCSSGICLCVSASGSVLRESGLVAETPGEPAIFVQRPRRGSAAADAGLERGDTILRADDKPVIPLRELQVTIREHAPGETVLLTVRKVSGHIENVPIIRPAF